MATKALFLLAVSLGLAAFGEAIVCDGSRVEATARSGRCLNDPLAYKCPDGSRCQCVAAVFQLCSVPHPTGAWKQGVKVTDNCSRIPKYTAVATFVNGRFKGHAGIFNRCVGGTIEMFDQWCGQPFKLRTKSGVYYVINR